MQNRLKKMKYGAKDHNNHARKICLSLLVINILSINWYNKIRQEKKSKNNYFNE